MTVPDSVLCKIIRADEHLQSFAADITEYFEQHPAKVVRQNEGSPDEYIAKVIVDKPIPVRLPLILGDYLQNLRSSLDYLVWELVLAAKNTPTKDNMFPICSTRDRFDQAITRRRLDGVPKPAQAVIECLQPYNCGDFEKSLLWIADDFCNINKHRRILLTRLHSGAAPEGTKTRVIDGKNWTYTDLAAVASNTKIGPFPIIGGTVKMPMNLHIISFIAFDEGAAKGVEITTVMRGMRDYIRASVLPLFNEFFI